MPASRAHKEQTRENVKVPTNIAHKGVTKSENCTDHSCHVDPSKPGVSMSGVQVHNKGTAIAGGC